MTKLSVDRDNMFTVGYTVAAIRAKFYVLSPQCYTSHKKGYSGPLGKVNALCEIIRHISHGSTQNETNDNQVACNMTTKMVQKRSFKRRDT